MIFIPIDDNEGAHLRLMITCLVRAITLHICLGKRYPHHQITA